MANQWLSLREALEWPGGATPRRAMPNSSSRRFQAMSAREVEEDALVARHLRAVSEKDEQLGPETSL